MNTQQNKALWAIVRERVYQDKKYGTPAERDLPIDRYLEIAAIELEEAMAAMEAADDENAKLEALQVAAVIVAMLERHGVVER